MLFEMRAPGALELDVNGEKRTVLARPADALLHVLRSQLGLTGARPGCETGDCGACTVLVHGWPVKSCLMLAVEALGRQVTTVEGVRNSAPIQQAFVEEQAFNCGYCTSGFIMVCHALATIHPDAGQETVNNWLESNVCRCTGYRETGEAIGSVLGMPADAAPGTGHVEPRLMHRRPTIGP